MTVTRCAPERKCRHAQCPRRAVRQGVCPDHWSALWGDRPAPYPSDLVPKSWRERQHRRLYGTAP